MPAKPPSPEPGTPRPDDIEGVLGFVPLLEAYFRRCAQVEMPAELQEIFADHGMTGRHGGVLAQLAAGPPVSVTGLARRMSVSLSTASELVGDLSRAGLVERREDESNRRRTLVSLSEAYRSTVEGFVGLRAAPLLKVLERLSPRDRQGFARGLEVWAYEVRNW